MMFYPAEDEKPPYHAEPEEGQVAPELPAGLSNEAEEEDEADAGAEAEPDADADSGSADDDKKDEEPPADA